MAGKKELFYAPKDFSNGFHASLAPNGLKSFLDYHSYFLVKVNQR
jgi:hypothetical protein